MSSLSQQAIEELFNRVSRRYFANALPENPTSNQIIIYKKQLDKFAREFIQIQRNLSDESIKKFWCLYFIGSIRYNQQKIHAAYQWLTKAKNVCPNKAYIFMDMYAGCLYILLSRKNRYGDALNAALNCFFQGIAAAKSNADEETYQRLKERYEYFFDKSYE